MPYKSSQLDRKLLARFLKDSSSATLTSLRFETGSIRGLGGFQIDFKYPITAISGKNGTGKSTLLGCIACAYHNGKNGFNPLSRKNTYYTFSDFLIQSEGEVPPSGIRINYHIHFDGWATGPPRIGMQSRIKNPNGKWNNYDSRVPRNVVFLGIERVVPHAEKSVSKSYRFAFQRAKDAGYEKEVRETVGKILGKPYEEFYYKYHSKYRLPVVSAHGNVYSGFNMGAGENALFEILSTIYACPKSLLLVIDEIELGLHEEAQTKLIEELKKICEQRPVQIVFSTHSSRILRSLPPEARIHLERKGGTLSITPEISSDYACGLMAGVQQVELDVFCEDTIAEGIILGALTSEMRARVRVVRIGSAAAVMRHLANRMKEPGVTPACGFLDGDKESKKKEHIRIFIDSLEHVQNAQSATNWIEDRLAFLPGGVRPELWLLGQHEAKAFASLVSEFGVTVADFNSAVEKALLADSHDELFVFAQELHIDAQYLRARLIYCALNHLPNVKGEIMRFLKNTLQAVSS